MDNDGSRQELAGEVWRLMFGFFIHTRPQRDAVLSRLGLTPTESKALFSLDATHRRTMKELATAWGCDASTATWVVDRLERAGLAERQPHPTDRRIRHVVLTEQGAATKSALVAAMYETPPELLALPSARLAQLRDLLVNLPVDGPHAANSPHPAPAGPPSPNTGRGSDDERKPPLPALADAPPSGGGRSGGRQGSG